MPRARRSALAWVLVSIAFVLPAGLAPPPAAADGEITPMPTDGFVIAPYISGLDRPVAFRIANDGTVFVAEEAGRVKTFDSIDDPTPSTLVDLTTQVHFVEQDRGLLGLEVHPSWPAVPWVWVLYAKDARPGGAAPLWGPQPGEGDDRCPLPEAPPPQFLRDGCVATGTLLRLIVDPATMTVTQTIPLIDGEWCQQFPSHSVGAIVYGDDGALYVGAGSGDSFDFAADYGQHGGTEDPQTNPTGFNPCGDPMQFLDDDPLPGTSEGGSLRAQDLRTAQDPLGLDGSILRLDPASGAALPDNPLFGGDTKDDRHIAIGLRNPYRFTARDVGPGHPDELWIGDVGWDHDEEIDVIRNPLADVPNFGWPCYEGFGVTPEWDALNNTLCETLYASGEAEAPTYNYPHFSHVPPVTPCFSGAVISAISFYEGGSYPEVYDGAVFFADAYSGWVCAMDTLESVTGDPTSVIPDVSTATAIATTGTVVDIQPGPGGDLFFLDLGGTLSRLQQLPCSETVDPLEPNDAPGQSRPLVDGQVIDSILCEHDVDWFRVDDIDANDTLVAELTFPDAEADLNLLLYDRDLQLSDFDVARGGTRAVVVRPTTTASLFGIHPYFLRVEARPPFSVNPYSLRIHICQNDDLRNDGEAVPRPLDLLARSYSAVHCPETADRYVVNAPNGSRVDVTALFSSAGPDLDLEARSWNTTVRADSPEASVERIQSFPIFGTTGVRVLGPDALAPESRVPYSIGATLLTPNQVCSRGVGDAFEPNDDLGTSTKPRFFAVNGVLCENDVDNFSVSVKEGQLLTAVVQQPNDAKRVALSLRDDNGETVSVARPVAHGRIVQFAPAQAGDYHLTLTQAGVAGSLQIEPYLLDARIEPVVVERFGRRVRTNGTGSRLANVIFTEVGLPANGQIAIAEGPSTSGGLLPVQVVISADSAEASKPAGIKFILDPVLLRTEWGDRLRVFVEGVLVQPCASKKVATPDPCVRFRQVNNDQGVEIQALASENGEPRTWTFAPPG